MDENQVIEINGSNEEIIDTEVQELNTTNVLVTQVPEEDANVDQINHAVLYGRELSDQHPISAITGLQNRLEDIETVKRVYSSENGLSEFRKWYDGNPEMSNRAGYFVKLVQGTDEIDICTDEDDVYGITVTNSGFVGNQVQSDKSDDPAYAMVGIAGALRVRTDGTARNGEYVVPNALGEATFSENNCGYKVISQGSYESYRYVTIAVTPQNDKISKIYGMLAEGGSDSVGGLIIQIEDLESQIKQNSQKVDIIVSDNESIKDIIAENQNNIKEVSNVSQTALNTAQEAKESVVEVVDIANEAASKAREAALEAQNAAEDMALVTQLAEEIGPLKDFESGKYKGVAGVVELTTDTQDIVGNLAKTVDIHSNEIAAATVIADKNGTMIQHLVSRIDRYSVGPYSTSESLNYDEAQSILVDECIYACTNDHIETMDADIPVEVHFERPEGIMYSYLWTPAYQNQETNEIIPGAWSQYGEVSTATTYTDGTNEGDLWYCWQDVEEFDQDGNVITTYVPGTLYVWIEGVWLAVATTSDNNQSRIVTLTKHTADGVKTEVVDARGNFSSLKQNLDSINSTIGDVDGNVSIVQQGIKDINSTISTIDGTITSLQQHADKTDASLAIVNSGRFHSVYKSNIGAAPEVYDEGNKYSLVPTWSDSAGEFVFDENFVDSTDGIYYFHSADKTKYCKLVDGGYEIYTIDMKVTSELDSRITTTNALLAGTTLIEGVDKEEKEYIYKQALSNITIASDIDGSTASLVSSYYHTLREVQEVEPTNCSPYKYTAPPVWNISTSKYEFDVADRGSEEEPGTYYLSDEDAQSYCRIVMSGGTEPKPLYEIYSIGASSNAAIVQEVTANRSTIGMIAESGEIKGSLIIEAINGDESDAKLDANKIHLTGTDEISLAVTGSDQKLSQIKQIVDNNSASIGLVVQDNQVKGSVLIEAINNDSTVKINAGKVNISGFVTVTNLATAGQTTINGSNITTGVIKSSGYSYTDGNTYSTAGTSFDLSNGVIRSKNFAIDADGSAYFRGNIEVGSKTVTLYTFDSNTGFTTSSITKPGFKVTSDGDASCTSIAFANDAVITSGEYFFFRSTTSFKTVHGIFTKYLKTNGIQFVDEDDDVKLGTIYQMGLNLYIKNLTTPNVRLYAKSDTGDNFIVFRADSPTKAIWKTVGSDLHIDTEGASTYAYPHLYLDAVGYVYIATNTQMAKIAPKDTLEIAPVTKTIFSNKIEFEQGATVDFADATVKFTDATVTGLHATFA